MTQHFTRSTVSAAKFVPCPFPFCVLRDSHEDDHDVRVPIEQFTAFEQLAIPFKKAKAA